MTTLKRKPIGNSTRLMTSSRLLSCYRPICCDQNKDSILIISLWWGEESLKKLVAIELAQQLCSFGTITIQPRNGTGDIKVKLDTSSSNYLNMPILFISHHDKTRKISRAEGSTPSTWKAHQHPLEKEYQKKIEISFLVVIFNMLKQQ